MRKTEARYIRFKDTIDKIEKIKAIKLQVKARKIGRSFIKYVEIEVDINDKTTSVVTLDEYLMLDGQAKAVLEAYKLIKST